MTFETSARFWPLQGLMLWRLLATIYNSGLGYWTRKEGYELKMKCRKFCWWGISCCHQRKIPSSLDQQSIFCTRYCINSATAFHNMNSMANRDVIWRYVVYVIHSRFYLLESSENIANHARLCSQMSSKYSNPPLPPIGSGQYGLIYYYRSNIARPSVTL